MPIYSAATALLICNNTVRTPDPNIYYRTAFMQNRKKPSAKIAEGFFCIIGRKKGGLAAALAGVK